LLQNLPNYITLYIFPSGLPLFDNRAPI